MADLKYIGKNILTHDLILKKGDVSGSLASTGSFGNLKISDNASITGDMVVGGTLTAQEIHTEIESASIIFTSGSTLFGNTQDDIHTFTGSLKITGSVTALNLTADSSSFSTRVTDLKSDSGSFSTRVTNLKSDSGSFSTRVTNLKADSGSFSTRITKNEGTGSKILNGELEFTNITASGTVQAEQLTSTDDITATGIITSNERINIQATNARLSLGPNAASIGSPALHGGVLYHDSSISGAALGNVSGFGATTSGNASNYFLLQLAGGSGMYMQVANNGAITFPSATSFTVPLITSTGDITANGNIVGDGATQIKDMALVSGSATSTGSFGRVKAADNMGIGVNSAHVGAGLTIKGTGASSADHGLRIAGDTGTLIVEGGSQSGISVIHGAAGGFWRMMSDGELEFGHHDNFNVGFYTNNTKRMVLNSGGNFSIGNTNNTHKLDVSGTGRFSDTLEVTSGNISGSATSTGSFGHGHIDNQLGVGTQNPDAEIHVIGESLSGDLVSTTGTNFGIIHVGGSTSTNTKNMITLGDFNSKPISAVGVHNSHGQGSSLFFGISTSYSSGVNRIPLTIGPQAADGQVKIESSGVNIVGNLTTTGNVSGSATSTGSFGLVLQNGNELSTFLGAAGTETLFSGSLVSTGSFGRLEATDMDIRGTGSFDKLTVGPRSATLQNYSGMKAQLTIEAAQDSALDRAIYIKQTPDDFGYVINTNGSVTGDFSLHNVAGGTEKTNPAISTGQDQKVGIGTFTRPEKLSVGGNIHSTGIVTASSFTGIFNGALSGSAQIASNISGAFAVASASFAADILSNSSSFASRDTLSEATSSKILNGELEFTNITGSGHVSMSLSSTGSFGRVSATTIGGHSPLIVDSKTTFTNSITSSAHVSSSMTSTASFARVNVIALGGHEALTIDPITTFTNVITASAQVEFDDKIFIQTGSFKGNLHVGTNADIMRIGKSTSGLIVSGSEQISRFATGSDGSIIDLGFTVTDEDGNVVLAGDGDGIHIDGNNYWYNNKYYKVGDGVNNFLNYDTQDGIRYKGELTVQTGSFGGEMFINSPTGSMFIGKFTGGIPSSGSDNVSRFATGSDGSIIDLGFTTTNEDGETVLLTTGDGIVRDDKNYWYTTGHFKVGDGQKQIEWNTTDLNISASTVDVTTLKASDVNFSNLPTSDPLITGSLWVSGSATSGSFKSGYVMISGIHG